MGHFPLVAGIVLAALGMEGRADARRRACAAGLMLAGLLVVETTQYTEARRYLRGA